MDIRELQRQVAVYVDELLSISVDMDTYVIEAYGHAPQEVVAMQCRIQLERLKRLGKKLVKIREELARAAGPEDGLEVSRPVQPESGEAGEPQGTCAETARQAGKPQETCAETARQAGKPEGICARAARQPGRMESPGARSSAERLSGEQRRSIAVTEQIIAQNLLLIGQKEELLNGFLAHSAMVGIQQKRAKELQDTAEIIRLKEALLHNS